MCQVSSAPLNLGLEINPIMWADSIHPVRSAVKTRIHDTLYIGTEGRQPAYETVLHRRQYMLTATSPLLVSDDWMFHLLWKKKTSPHNLPAIDDIQ